ncbi:MAG: HD-GYP domain-containing protein [Oscillospiraceae bacterium]
MKIQPIPIDFLPPGTEIDFQIYDLQNGNLKLICQNTVMTEGLLSLIRRKIGNKTLVYVNNDIADRMNLEFTLRKIQVRKAEIKTNYTALINQAHNIIEDAIKFGSISEKNVQLISTEIFDKIIENDGSLLIQCINSVRDADEYTYTHCVNVAFLNGMIGKWHNMKFEDIANLVKTGLVHDLGKIYVPMNILNKPTSLTTSEFEIVKTHPKRGTEILLRSGERNVNIISGVYQHHEKINGTGYPCNLKYDNISLFGKITAVSDVYDAMINKRSYKNALSPFQVLHEMSASYHSHLDINIATLFLERMPVELIGKRVILSDGTIAKVEMVDRNNLRFPIVSAEKSVFQTDENLYCIEMIAE